MGIQRHGGGLSQELYMMRIGMVSEMLVEGKDSAEAEMVYHGKACAVGKAKFSIIKLSKHCLCSGFNIFGYSKDVYAGILYPVHKLDGSSMAASHLKEGVSLIKDIIGCVKNGLSFYKLLMNRFGLWIVLVVRNGESAECASVYKDLQYGASPYRYLS